MATPSQTTLATAYSNYVQLLALPKTKQQVVDSCLQGAGISDLVWKVIKASQNKLNGLTPDRIVVPQPSFQFGSYQRTKMDATVTALLEKINAATQDDTTLLQKISHVSEAYLKAHAKAVEKLMKPSFLASLGHVTKTTVKTGLTAAALLGVGLYAHSRICSNPAHIATCQDLQTVVLETLRSVSPQAAEFANRDWTQLVLDTAQDGLAYINSFYKQ